MKRRLACFAALALASCGGHAEQEAADGKATEAASHPPQPVTAPEAPNAVTRPLPIATGVYVIAGTRCADPANAAFRIYDGTGISGSATRDCRLERTAREGERYSFDQSCVDTYSGERTRWPIKVTVERSDAFTLEDGDETTRFVRCAPGTPPDYLEKMAG